MLYSGGGNDIFIFGKDWGADCIELPTETVEITIWFEEGDQSYWDPYWRIYDDGSNSVRVNNEYCTVKLQFGRDENGLYDQLQAAGAFESSSGEKIFEDPDSGMLA